jgi:3-hydroxyisobutyrate dehydrogenase-like beta-hydroxyacid dehydrogenase
MSAKRVGLCGSGNMGSAIAARLAGRVELVVYDVDSERRRVVSEACGVPSADTLEQLADGASAIVLSLPTAAVSAAVVGKLATAMDRGGVIIETSTVGPDDLRRLAPTCREAGLELVDAAILSGVAQMRDGQSTLLVGGDDHALAVAAPVLDALAPERLHLGELGSGMAAKVANNAVSHAVMVVLLEATALAAAAGVSPARFTELLSRPDAGLLRPLEHRLRERVATGDYEGGMPTEAALKDSALALGLARDTGVPLFAIAAAHEPYEHAVRAGYGREDYASLARLWEDWTGRRLGGGAP